MRWIRALAGGWLSCAFLVAHAATAGSDCAEQVVAEGSCAETEIWVANTRSGGCDDPPRLSRCTDETGWTKAKLAELKALPPHWSTCVWIHGNDNSDADARYQGEFLLKRLARHAAPEHGIRMLVWSWPSEKTGAGPLEDLRIKADRSDDEALRLAAFLRRWQPTERVTFVGYSFGARIITGALDELAEQPPADGQSGAADPMVASAILLAPAMNNCWLLPGYPHGAAVTQVQELLIVKNPIDRALKWYPLVAYGRVRSGPQALGYTGLSGQGRLGEDAKKVAQFNVSGIVGREHDVMLYLSSSRIVGRMAPCVFGQAADDHGD